MTGGVRAGRVRRGLRLVVFIGLPASVGLMLVSDPLTAVIYQGGEFTPEQGRRVAAVLFAYAPAIWAYSMAHVLTRAFYARDDAKRPVRIAVYIGRDRPGLLAEITTAISSRQGNIIKAEITVTDDRKGLNYFVVEVDDLRQLQDIMHAIREVKDIANVERVRGV